MANSPDVENILRSARLRRELDARIIKRFQANPSMSITDVYVRALEAAAEGVELSDEEKDKIENDKREAARKLGKNK